MSTKSGLSAAVDNAADPEQVKQAELHAKIIESDDTLDTQWVLSSPAGRRFIMRYLDACDVFEDTFHADPIHHARLAGIRYVGLQLLSDVKRADPEALLDMLDEQQEAVDGTSGTKRKRRTRRKRKSRSAPGGK